MSVPCGFVDEMPIGMQIMGNYFDEKKIFEVGLSYELNNNWRNIKPEIK
jgi:aspartyl-tRNA(Asn)/glutamyl-tRNA(Gln) amidotransferase subunit A